ncbi:alpha/beta fold hydrolase [Sediminimonas qiaohouensis]|uniref:alpha/beta fold hydrolase n=1 Tax=Sediminimonas qiaohouensis TaxID=552061 RepID=UPI00041FD1A4|nr:alpha/beta hydrolase [Sediminimonas qiaohouensis]
MIWAIAGMVALAVLAAWPFVMEWRKQSVEAVRRAGAPGQIAHLPQGDTHYNWAGPQDGPVAVCVHGLTTPSQAWIGVADGLAEMGYRVLSYDLYGRGYSDRPGGIQDRAHFLRQLDDLLSNQGVGDDITLLGYSMGGAIASAFAATEPGRLRHLILVAPAGMGHDLGPMARITRDVPGLGDWLFRVAFARGHRNATEAERHAPATPSDIVDIQQAELGRRGFVPAILASLRGMLKGNSEAEHRRIAAAGIPVLAIWGREDTVIPLSARDVLAAWNPQARHAIIDGAGHGLPYTHSTKVIAAIRAEVTDSA